MTRSRLAGILPNINMKTKKGLSLIEVVVVAGLMMVLIGAVSGALLNTFRAKRRTRENEKIVQNGSRVQAELKRNILNSLGETISCTNSSVTFTGLDGQETTLSCSGERIASASASRTVYITGSEVRCDEFAVTCNQSGGRVNKVNFSYRLTVGQPGTGFENFVQQTFRTEVTVRN